MANRKEASNLKEIVSRNLRIFRIENGFTQKEVAEKAGYHVTYYARLEKDPQNISLEGLERLSKALDRNVLELLAGKNIDSSDEARKLVAQALKILQILAIKIS